MKRIFTNLFSILMSSFFLVNGVIAQSDHDACISLSIGSANPIGDFAMTDIDNEDAGGADPGVGIELALNYDVTEKFGIKLSGFTQFNPMNDGFMQDAVNNLPSGYSVDYTGYGLFGYMLGGYYNHEFARLKIRPRISIGLLNATSPEYNFYFLQQKVLQEKAVESSAFATQLGADVAFDISRFRITLQFDYLTANPAFNSELINVSDNSVAERYSWKQDVSTTSFRIGLGYLFTLEALD